MPVESPLSVVCQSTVHSVPCKCQSRVRSMSCKCQSRVHSLSCVSRESTQCRVSVSRETAQCRISVSLALYSYRRCCIYCANIICDGAGAVAVCTDSVACCCVDRIRAGCAALPPLLNIKQVMQERGILSAKEQLGVSDARMVLFCCSVVIRCS